MRASKAEVMGMAENVELLEGELVRLEPQSPARAQLVSRLARRLTELYGGSFTVRVRLPLDAGELSLLVPDIAVVRGGDRTYIRRHPRVDETVLVFEFSPVHPNKAGIYARSGARELCVIDPGTQVGECFESPRPGYYARARPVSLRDLLYEPL